MHIRYAYLSIFSGILPGFYILLPAASLISFIYPPRLQQ